MATRDNEELWKRAAEVYPDGGARAVQKILREAGYPDITLSTIRDHMSSRGVFRRRARPPESIPISESAEEITDEMISVEVKHEQEIEGLRRQVRTWKRKYEEAKKRGSLDTEILSLMRDYQASFPVPKVKKPNTEAPKRREIRETLVLLLSDLHVGEFVSPESTHGINKYDISVFLARMERLMDRVHAIAFEALQGYTFEELVIYCLGDLINGQFGAMHDELIVTQASGLMETVYGTAYVINQFLVNMLQYFERIRVVAVPGNHGRMTKRQWAKDAEMNWDSIIPQICSTQFSGSDRVSFLVPNSFFFIDEIRGQRFLGLHGHQIRGWAGIPWYGINRIIGNLDEVFAHNGPEIHHAVMGHFHQAASVEKVKGEVIATGCVKGPDEYSLGAGVKPSPASQIIFGVHADHGITHRWKIDLQDAYEPSGILEWWPGGTLGDAFANLQTD